jgi:hypothetical protein
LVIENKLPTAMAWIWLTIFPLPAVTEGMVLRVVALGGGRIFKR